MINYPRDHNGCTYSQATLQMYVLISNLGAALRLKVNLRITHFYAHEKFVLFMLAHTFFQIIVRLTVLKAVSRR